MEKFCYRGIIYDLFPTVSKDHLTTVSPISQSIPPLFSFHKLASGILANKRFLSTILTLFDKVFN